MRTFAQQPKTTQQTTPTKLAIRSRSPFGQTQDPNSILNLQQTIGNQAVQRLLKVSAGDVQTKSNATEGRRLLAHELTHVVQQSAGHAPRAVVRQRAEDSESDKPKAPPKAPKCETGCAQRWGQDTTCSKWGFRVGEHEHAPHYVLRGEGKKTHFIPCCNSWPFALEEFARDHLGLNGAASCPVQHEKEIATLGFGGKEVQVLCSDTISNAMVGPTKNPKDCSGKITTELIEMSPKAMQDLSGQVGNALHVSVCFSGSKQDLCPHDGPGKASRPQIEHCLTDGCTPEEGTPRLEKTGWPLS